MTLSITRVKVGDVVCAPDGNRPVIAHSLASGRVELVLGALLVDPESGPQYRVLDGADWSAVEADPKAA